MIDSIEAQSGTAHTHDNTIPVDSATRTSGTGSPPSSPPTLGSTTCYNSSGTSSSSKVVYASPASSAFVDVWVTSAESGNKVTTTTTTDTVTQYTACYGSGGSGPSTIYVVARATSTTQNYTFNAIQDVLNDANTATFVTMVTALQTGNDDTYGAGYRDPNEPSSPNLKTDVTFDANTATMSGLISSANTYHLGVTSGTSNGYSDGVAHTYSNTAYNNFITGIGTFQTAMTLRISEITARIGYLNGKNVANGGSADGSGTAGSGFAGTSFNSGNGYANTIYAHANFLAGKKIKLVQKILTAIEDVSSLYTQIKAKRSEYYEYNQ